MRFRLLGAVQVDDDEGRLVDVCAFKLRSLLAFLLLRENEVVTRDALVDAIWNGAPPPSANHGLDVLICRLRRLLVDSSGRRRLRKVPGGYVLEVLPAELDVDRFEHGVDAGRKALACGRLAAAAELLGSALDEWHGSALGDVAYQSFAVAGSARLEELHIDAMEDLFEAELRLGRHVDVLPALESLVASNPLRERARAQLMLALYRAGRHAEALETYRVGRRQLAEEHGLEPDEELRLLYVQILRQDKSLNRLDRGHELPDETPPTKNAQDGDGAIAYQTSGAGPFDVLYVPSFVTNVELVWGVRT